MSKVKPWVIKLAELSAERAGVPFAPSVEIEGGYSVSGTIKAALNKLVTDRDEARMARDEYRTLAEQHHATIERLRRNNVAHRAALDNVGDTFTRLTRERDALRRDLNAITNARAETPAERDFLNHIEQQLRPPPPVFVHVGEPAALVGSPAALRSLNASFETPHWTETIPVGGRVSRSRVVGGVDVACPPPARSTDAEEKSRAWVLVRDSLSDVAADLGPRFAWREGAELFRKELRAYPPAPSIGDVCRELAKRNAAIVGNREIFAEGHKRGVTRKGDGEVVRRTMDALGFTAIDSQIGKLWIKRAS